MSAKFEGNFSTFSKTSWQFTTIKYCESSIYRLLFFVGLNAKEAWSHMMFEGKWKWFLSKEETWTTIACLQEHLSWWVYTLFTLIALRRGVSPVLIHNSTTGKWIDANDKSGHVILRLPHRYAVKTDPPLHVSLNNFATRPSFKNPRDNFLTKWTMKSKVCLHFQGDI